MTNTEKLRVHKTPTAKRGTYTYTDAMGQKYVLIPGMVDPSSGKVITEDHIKLLHLLDDAEVRNNLRNGRPELTAAEKQQIAEWEDKHPGEKAPRNWNLSIDFVMEDDEHESERAAIEGITDSKPVSPEVEMLRAAVETMTERQRQVYELHYLKGFNVKETAAILGMSSPTVTNHKKRIEEIIRKFFEGANFQG